ncbi:MAG TPA: hypothetical protein PLZ57_08290 [Pseudobdellovibrionaceae bacterium]|nr:hypothetical protein [Pseudobdellovibrionaceae bacterium]
MKLPSIPVLAALALGIAIAAALSLAHRLGAFREVHIEVSTVEPLLVLAQEHLGAYHTTHQKIVEVENWAKQQGHSCRFSFGEYFDNPELVDEDRLKSRGGCVLTDEPALKLITELSTKGQLPQGFRLEQLGERRALVAHFDGSPAIGPWKVYSKAQEKMAQDGLQQGGAVMEIYEILGPDAMRTRYIFPLAP